MMRNFTNRHLRFASTDNLTALLSGRYIAKSEEDLQVFMTIPKQPVSLSCQVRREISNYIDGIIPVIREEITGVDPIPEGDDLLIVSAQYAMACRHFCLPTHRLRIVTGPIFIQGNSLPAACHSLSSVEACLYFDIPEAFNGFSTAADIYDIRFDRLK